MHAWFKRLAGHVQAKKSDASTSHQFFHCCPFLKALVATKLGELLFRQRTQNRRVIPNGMLRVGIQRTSSLILRISILFERFPILVVFSKRSKLLLLAATCQAALAWYRRLHLSSQGKVSLRWYDARQFYNLGILLHQYPKLRNQTVVCCIPVKMLTRIPQSWPMWSRLWHVQRKF